jgi:excisionase family DNA binding protein
MSEDFAKDELLEVPQIARYLRVSDVTVYRWCREGQLPCLKLGHSWRVRRSALEDFLARGERSTTLVGQLRSFYRVPRQRASERPEPRDAPPTRRRFL